MLHCPYCGSKIKEDELYCITCGKELPGDINNRRNLKKKFNTFWYVPIATLILLFITTSIYYFILQNNRTQAKHFYEEAEDNVLNEDYIAAEKNFKKAIKLKKNFYEADVALDFVQHVLKVNEQLDQANKKLEKNNFQDALTIVDDAESSLNQFHGLAINHVIDYIIESQDAIKVAQLKNQLEKNIAIEDLKTILWQAEAIKNNEAIEITANIRKQIIDYTFSRASEQLNSKQFSDALKLVEDGLKYASDSDKLQSLRTTIDKEKTAFETAEQQRIEKAIHIAAEEDEMNSLDAVKLDSVKVTKDKQDKLVVKGEVISVATIPISSVLVEYSLLNDQDNELATNKVFVYPDTLYPDEVGKFEFTHYDFGEGRTDVKIKVKKITWFTD